MSDPVNHPAHRTSHPSGIECIRIVEHMTFCCGSAMQHLWRAGLKAFDARENLCTAKWFIERELKRLDGEARDASGDDL